MSTRMRAGLLAIGALALSACLGGCIVAEPADGGYGHGGGHGYRHDHDWGRERVVYVSRGDPNCR